MRKRIRVRSHPNRVTGGVPPEKLSAMNKPDLPEDVTHWPEDPYQLLGVDRGSSVRDLKRSYARLLRRFKPERFPEQFRRIRQAYEALLRYAEWFGSVGQASPAVDSEPTSESPADKAAPVPLSSAPDDHARTVDDCWQWVCAGKEEEAYASLRKIQERQPQMEETYVRLYWLLWTRPELDASRLACEWLEHGLRQTRRPGILLNLLRDELLENPAEALGDRYLQLLDVPFSPQLLSALLEARWLAADRCAELKSCWSDLDTFRSRFAADEEALWLLLVVALAARLACPLSSLEGQLFDLCSAECQRYKHLGLTHSDAFDQLEVLVEIRRHWPRIRAHNIPESMLHLLRLGRNRPFEEVRPDLEEVLSRLSESPGKWLRYLDLIQGTVPGVLSRFSELVEQLLYSRGQPREVALDDQTVLRFAAVVLQRGELQRGYYAFRRRLLTSCLKEAISPERLADVMGGVLAGWPTKHSSLADALLQDWPLRYVYQACAVFWS
jgi:hypothetical protein